MCCSLTSSHPDCYQCKAPEPASVMHICDDPINAEINIKYLEQHILASSTTMQSQILQVLQQRRMWMLIWPACSPNLSLIEILWCIMWCKIPKQKYQTVEWLELYINQEWESFDPPKKVKCINIMRHSSRNLLRFVRREGDVTQ